MPPAHTLPQPRIEVTAGLTKLGMAALLVSLALPVAGRPSHAQSYGVQAIYVDSTTVRPVLRKLWIESVHANKELVACIGGYRFGDIFRLDRAAALYSLIPYQDSARRGPEFDADSMGVSRYLSELSVETCKPPDWVGTVHTHRMEGGREYPKLSSDDRGVISLWHERWSNDSVFCVLFSGEKPPYCEYRPGPIAR